jgi:TonB-dependent receptor
MQEENIQFKMDLSVPFSAWNELNSKLLLGGSYLEKERNFDEQIFEYRFESGQGGRNFSGDVDDYFAQDNLGVIGQTESGRYRYGLYIRDNTMTSGGSYDANEIVPAAYAAFDFQFTPKLKANFGARYEQTNIEITNNNETLPDTLRFGSIKADDIFPAVNLTYELIEDMNLRLAYSKTIARPTFRELARFASFEFLGDFVLVGNPNLERTLIDNMDFRWEFFPNRNDMISFSAFYKKFENPIERAISPTASTDLNIQFTYRNVPQAEVWGLEFELRKNLAFIADQLRFFKLGTNLTLLDSRVDIAPGELLLIRQNDPTAESTRVMFGQAPYIVNAYLNYSNTENLWSANVNYNVLGDRLSYVGVAGTPNVFEKPRPTLDFNISKGLNAHWTVKLSANNLLDAATRFTHDFKGIEYEYQTFRLGRTFSLGITYLVD